MVYYDAKKLVLPEYSFPAREVVNMMVSKFKYNSDDNIITNTDLQYMIPLYAYIIIIHYNRYIYGNITKKNKKWYCNISSVRR